MSIKELKKKEKEERRNYIIDAAQKLFLIKDYADVAMNDIADEVGVNKATIYYYFKSKEALYFAVVLRGLRVLDEMIRKDIKKGTTGLEKVRIFGNVCIITFLKYPDNLKMLYASRSNIQQFDMGNMNSSEEIKEIKELLEGFVFIISDSIQIGIADGSIRPDVDPVEAAVLMSLAYNGIWTLSPVHEKILKSRGIDRQKFLMDTVENFIQRMLMKP